jgi:hypothetical protein
MPPMQCHFPLFFAIPARSINQNSLSRQSSRLFRPFAFDRRKLMIGTRAPESESRTTVRIHVSLRRLAFLSAQSSNQALKPCIPHTTRCVTSHSYNSETSKCTAALLTTSNPSRHLFSSLVAQGVHSSFMAVCGRCGERTQLAPGEFSRSRPEPYPSFIQGRCTEGLRTVEADYRERSALRGLCICIGEVN